MKYKNLLRVRCKSTSLWFPPSPNSPNQMWTSFLPFKSGNYDVCVHRHESGHMRRDKWKIVLKDKNVRVGNLHSQAKSMSQITNEWTGGCDCCTFYWEEWILPWYKVLSVSGHECCSSPKYKGQIFSFAWKQTHWAVMAPVSFIVLEVVVDFGKMCVLMWPNTHLMITVAPKLFTFSIHHEIILAEDIKARSGLSQCENYKSRAHAYITGLVSNDNFSTFQGVNEAPSFNHEHM